MREIADTGPGELLERAQQQGTPLIEGEMVTFVWGGSTAPHLVGDFNHWDWNEPIVLTAIAPGIWAHHLQLPLDAYMEYAYIYNGDRVLDPLNPHVANNGLGAFNNVFAMPAAEGPKLAHSRRGIPHGTLTRYVVDGGFLVVGRRRVVYLYHPPTVDPVPLLVVLDGNDYLRRGRLATVVDNLIAQGHIPPIAMALVHHGKEARFIEYDCSDSTISFLVRSVLPLAQEHLNLLDPVVAPYAILGASMGGLQALYAGIRVPDLFGRVLSQSGAFGLEVAGEPSVIYPLLRTGPAPRIRIWMDVGRYEPLLESNRYMATVLHELGYDVQYQEFNGAHNYGAWRNDVWRGLHALFGV